MGLKLIESRVATTPTLDLGFGKEDEKEEGGYERERNGKEWVVSRIGLLPKEIFPH